MHHDPPARPARRASPCPPRPKACPRRGQARGRDRQGQHRHQPGTAAGCRRRLRARAEERKGKGSAGRRGKDARRPALFVPTAGRRLQAQTAKVVMPAFGARPRADDHADIDASYAFRCASPAALKSSKPASSRASSASTASKPSAPVRRPGQAAADAEESRARLVSDRPMTALRITDLVFRWPRQAQTASTSRARTRRRRTRLPPRPSGSGKSTLLGLLGGVALPQQGRIELLGTDITQLGSRARDRFRADHIGFLFQQFNLLPWLPAIDNVLLPCTFSRAAANAPAPTRAPRPNACCATSTSTPQAGASRPASFRSASSSASPRRAR
jgi:hypothetical protein